MKISIDNFLGDNNLAESHLDNYRFYVNIFTASSMSFVVYKRIFNSVFSERDLSNISQ